LYLVIVGGSVAYCRADSLLIRLLVTLLVTGEGAGTDQQAALCQWYGGMNDDGFMSTFDNPQVPTGEIVASLSEMYRVVQKLEEEFGVMLPDDELTSVRTAGQLYRLIQLELTTQPNPPPALAFHRLRLALQADSRTSRTVLRPSTPLALIFPRALRQEQWKHLANSTNLTLPPLRLPRWLRDQVRIATGLAAAGSFAGMVLLTRPDGLLWFPPLLMAAFAGLVTYRVLFVVTQPLVLEYPVKTLSELAQTLVETYPEQFLGPGLPADSPEAAWQRFIQTLGRELCVDPVDIHADSSIFTQGHTESTATQKPHSLGE